MKEKKTNIPSLSERQTAHKQKIDEADLKSQLLGISPIFTREQHQDEYLDFLSQKIVLIGGRELTVEDCIRTVFEKYEPRFPRLYFTEVARLHGLPESVVDTYRKTIEFPTTNLECLYARFPIKVQKRLKQVCKWSSIPFVRKQKFFQWLTPQACELLDSYIQDFLDMSKNHETYSSFKVAWKEAYFGQKEFQFPKP